MLAGVIEYMLDAVVTSTCKSTQTPVYILHFGFRVSTITLSNTAGNLELPYKQMRGRLLYCKYDISAYLSLEVINIDSTMILAALFADY